MNEPKPEALNEDNDVVAYREFCYRWTCSCGAINRQGAIRFGFSNYCSGCRSNKKIAAYVNDNGAVVKLVE